MLRSMPGASGWTRVLVFGEPARLRKGTLECCSIRLWGGRSEEKVTVIATGNRCQVPIEEPVVPLFCDGERGKNHVCRRGKLGGEMNA